MAFRELVGPSGCDLDNRLQCGVHDCQRRPLLHTTVRQPSGGARPHHLGPHAAFRFGACPGHSTAHSTTQCSALHVVQQHACTPTHLQRPEVLQLQQPCRQVLPVAVQQHAHGLRAGQRQGRVRGLLPPQAQLLQPAAVLQLRGHLAAGSSAHRRSAIACTWRYQAASRRRPRQQQASLLVPGHPYSHQCTTDTTGAPICQQSTCYTM